MERFTERPVTILTGLVLAAASMFGQAYTISARPGAVNYVEGNTFLNGEPVSDKNLKTTFLSNNDALSTGNGKAEVLLTPGVFLRIGEDSEIRMISSSLTDTQVEVVNGEVMVEASGLVKENHLQILDHGATITIVKNGLYKVTAGNPPTAAVLSGKADVLYSDRHVGLGKGKETTLSADLPVQRFDSKREDDLYAWSNVRSEYDAASSYQLSRNASLSGSSIFNNGYGYNSGFGPGWFWDSGFSSYAWLPGNGIFYSPFGYGFYSPAYVGYAPVVSTYVYRGGRPWRHPNGTPATPVTAPAAGMTAKVPVSLKSPPAIGRMEASPLANQQARAQTARAFATSPAAGWQGGTSHLGGVSHASSGFGGSASHMGGGTGGGGHTGGGGGRGK